MRAADVAARPPEERPAWYKPRKGGHAGEHRAIAEDIQLSAYAVKRLKRAGKIQKHLRKRRGG